MAKVSVGFTAILDESTYAYLQMRAGERKLPDAEYFGDLLTVAAGNPQVMRAVDNYAAPADRWEVER